MKQFSDLDIREDGLIILDDVHKFCEEHNLKYVLFFGTLIGAVRHQGYIPWDDDVDIAMPREDYEYFIKNYDNNRFGVKSPRYDSKYYLPWAKAYDKTTEKIEPLLVEDKLSIGFNIDIFPLDEFSSIDNYWEVKQRQYPLIEKLYNAHTARDKSGFKNFLKKVARHKDMKRVNEYCNEFESFFLVNDPLKEPKTCLVANSLYMGVKTRNYSFPIDLFNKRKLVKFENREYYIPEAYDEILTTCYGDYMKLPPKEQQVTHHDFIAYFK